MRDVSNFILKFLRFISRSTPSTPYRYIPKGDVMLFLFVEYNCWSLLCSRWGSGSSRGDLHGVRVSDNVCNIHHTRYSVQTGGQRALNYSNMDNKENALGFVYGGRLTSLEFHQSIPLQARSGIASMYKIKKRIKKKNKIWGNPCSDLPLGLYLTNHIGVWDSVQTMPRSGVIRGGH